MKTLLLSLSLATLTLFGGACKNAVNPDAAQTVSGSYDLKYMSVNAKSETFPTSANSGSLAITKVSYGFVQATLVVTRKGVPSTDTDYYQAEQNGDEIVLKNQGSTVGRLTGKVVKMDIPSGIKKAYIEASK